MARLVIFLESGVRYTLPALLLLLSFAASATEYSLAIADVVAPGFSARGIRLVLPADGSADLQLARVQVRQYTFDRVHIRCARFSLSTAQLSCHNGKMDAVPGARVEFSYGFATRHMQLSLHMANGEIWQADARFDDQDWQVTAQLHNAQGKRLVALLPPDMPASDLLSSMQGVMNGTLRTSGNAAGLAAFNVDLKLADAGFSDVSGLHAAEKLQGTIKFDAVRKEASWSWQGNLDWQRGEMFWQPLYLKGGYRLDASGNFDGKHLEIGQATAELPNTGRVQFSALWDIGKNKLLECASRGSNLDLRELFDEYAKPFLTKGTLAESTLYGKADVEWRYRDGSTQSLNLVLHDAGIADASQRFALLGVNTRIEWQADAATAATIAFSGGALLGVPLGAGQWAVQMRGMEFNVPQAVLPVMDGKLELQDFRLYRDATQPEKPCDGCAENDAWRWEFSAQLSQISMEQFSRAAGWPKMHGTLAGRIPKISYSRKEIRTNGALMFNVFDGAVMATQLVLADPFGRAPRLSGNLNMRNLDLDLLTRTFSFGNMQGRIDVDVNNMQLQNWQPASFDAHVSSSAGSYPKKISQKAVQNITALGGSGAGAALQRSYLGFFENFRYSRIGWRCELRNGVCAMSGLGEGEGMAYPIIQGAGIPSINVIGYNRTVSWDELITRLKRVIQSNTRPIIK